MAPAILGALSHIKRSNGLDTGAPLATKEANEAWLIECRKVGGRFGGDAKSREASIAELRAFLGEVFSR